MSRTTGFDVRDGRFPISRHPDGSHPVDPGPDVLRAGPHGYSRPDGAVR